MSIRESAGQTPLTMGALMTGALGMEGIAGMAGPLEAIGAGRVIGL